MEQIFGVVAKTNVEIFEEYLTEVEIANEYQYSPKTTNLFAPEIAPSYHIVHAPQLQFNSPYGSVGGAPISTASSVTGHEIEDTLTPTQVIEQAQSAEQTQEGGGIGSGGGGMDMLIIGAVVVIGAIFILPMLLKKKVKAKVKTPAGIGGSVDT